MVHNDHVIITDQSDVISNSCSFKHSVSKKLHTEGYHYEPVKVLEMDILTTNTSKERSQLLLHITL